MALRRMNARGFDNGQTSSGSAGTDQPSASGAGDDQGVPLVPDDSPKSGHLRPSRCRTLKEVRRPRNRSFKQAWQESKLEMWQNPGLKNKGFTTCSGSKGLSKGVQKVSEEVFMKQAMYQKGWKIHRYNPALAFVLLKGEAPPATWVKRSDLLKRKRSLRGREDSSSSDFEMVSDSTSTDWSESESSE